MKAHLSNSRLSSISVKPRMRNLKKPQQIWTANIWSISVLNARASLSFQMQHNIIMVSAQEILGQLAWGYQKIRALRIFQTFARQTTEDLKGCKVAKTAWVVEGLFMSTWKMEIRSVRWTLLSLIVLLKLRNFKVR